MIAIIRIFVALGVPCGCLDDEGIVDDGANRQLRLDRQDDGKPHHFRRRALDRPVAGRRGSSPRREIAAASQTASRAASPGRIPRTRVLQRRATTTRTSRRSSLCCAKSLSARAMDILLRTAIPCAVMPNWTPSIVALSNDRLAFGFLFRLPDLETERDIGIVAHGGLPKRLVAGQDRGDSQLLRLPIEDQERSTFRRADEKPQPFGLSVEVGGAGWRAAPRLRREWPQRGPIPPIRPDRKIADAEPRAALHRQKLGEISHLGEQFDLLFASLLGR